MADPGRIPRVTPEDALGAFMNRDDRAEPMTAPEIAEELDCSRRTALNKLHTLEEDGEVTSKKVGGRSKVWWTPIPREERAETGQEPARGDAGGNEKETEEASPDTERANVTDDDLMGIVDRVAELKSWSDSDSRLKARKRAALAVLQYARDHGGVSKQEAEEEIYPEHNVENQSPRTWYRKNIRPVLNEAAEYDQGVKRYRLTEPDV